jgi:LEA14-like dessication related protein
MVTTFRSRVSAHRRAVVAACSSVTLVTALTACAALGRGSFKEPVVNLKEFSITGLGTTGGSVDIVLSVYNPNGFNLDAVAMTYRVDVDSIKLGDGTLDGRFVVPKGDSTTVRLPVRFTYAGLGQAGRSLITSGTVNYRVRGDFTVATPIGNFTRPYDRNGRYSSLSRGGQ